LSDPSIPEVANTGWPRNPIDHFILARLEAEGLSPSPPAARATWIRRVTFDLTGLPPAPEDVDRFIADEHPQAHTRVIDRLLASPAYGERWAQHWLDLARFAESDGFEHDHVRPDAWKYRDWVIEALNDDLPYDEFVRLQIAGDLLSPGDTQAAVATGFALCGPDMTDINLLEERRHMVLNDITATVGSVFLGLQIGCAECHDHKYDPLSQADFYRLRAFFEPALHFQKHPFGRVLHEGTDGDRTTSHVRVRGDFRRPGPQVMPATPRIAAIRGASHHHPLESEGEHPRASRTDLASWLTREDNFLSTRVIVNRLWQHHFGRGLVETPSDFGRMGNPPSHPELLDWLSGELSRGGWSLKHMHRLMLASATYRQASHLHDGATSDASWEQLDVAVQSWQQAEEADPENRLLWRANRQRLEGEAIRDAMLAASDRLSRGRGGRGVMPPLPEELVVTLLKDQWQVSEDPEDHRRRSIYLFARRNLRYPLFEAFDRPDSNASCPRRSRSTIAPQALFLLNSEFSMMCARDLAAYILHHASDDIAAQIDLAYRRTLGRHPTDKEQTHSRGFLAERAKSSRLASPAEDALSQDSFPPATDPHRAAALTYLCLALFNLNEFIYVD
jgi:hypothetical protein